MAKKLAKYVTAPELGRMLGCSRQRIHQLLQKYEVPVERVGRYLIIKRTDVKKFLEQREMILQLSGSKGNREVGN